MKTKIQVLINQALSKLQNQGLEFDIPKNIAITHTKDKDHGDYASNIAMVLCGKITPKQNPKALAEQIVVQLPPSDLLTKIEVAGGFINFFVNQDNNNQVITEILAQKNTFGHRQIGNNRAILIEFVSANPTGPLHVGHGRGAAYGSSVANLLRAVGFEVDCEYYVNDAGRQMDILATSVYIRYLQQLSQEIVFPDNGYKGDYISDIAQELVQQYGDKFKQNSQDFLAGAGKDECDGGDKEIYIDNLIGQAKSLLSEDYHIVFDLSIKTILADIQADLADFRVNYDKWFSEQSLMQSDLVKKTLNELKSQGVVYEKAGALWFRSTDFGDEKDRVVVRDNGQSTYFASDIAYHLEKITRELHTNTGKHQKHYETLINIWGADHHGYIPRVRAGISALKHDEQKLEVLLVQFAHLYRGKVKVPMSTRSGSFVTLRELRDEVGVDATRFFYILRKSEQHMDFDLELAKSKTNDNPVFYIQYAHARICRVLANITDDTNTEAPDLSLLTHDNEQNLIKQLNKYSGVLLSSATAREPHQMAYYLKDLASALHSYYGSCEFLGKDKSLSLARITLIRATKQVFRNGLFLLGVDAPDSM